MRTLVWLVSLLSCIGAHADEIAPTRVVSLNPCLDGLLVELAPRAHIAAISHYSRDPDRSTIVAIARELPITYETAEEVVALQPDLVLAGRHSAIATRNALRRVGIRFELFEVPLSIADSHTQIRRLATLLHEEARGEALIARIEAAIAAARPAEDAPILSAAVYQPGGLTAGARTITDELMGVVKLANVPSNHGIQQHRPMPLEDLLRAAPDILLVGTTSPDGTHAERLVQHRALRALEGRMHQAEYPARLLYCAGPTMVLALDALAAARVSALAARSR